MSTLLQLVNQTREECDVSRSGDLVSLTGITGENQRIKNWVVRSWNEIQSLHEDWRWMRATYSFVTTAGNGEYTSTGAGIASRFNRWDKTYCSVYLTATGTNDQIELGWMDYADFRSIYLTGVQSNSRPQYFTIGDAGQLLLGPKPESTLYTISGYYHKSPQELSADGDIPELPEQHEVIVYRAMRKYARFEVAAEITNDAFVEEKRILCSLRNKYLPEVRF